MQAYNAENIESLEDCDIARVEEAQSFSERSLRLLRPTIRKEGSQIWFSWNPRYETDAVDKFFRGGRVCDDAALVKVNDQMGTYIGPLHDISSHGADAFGEYAVNCHFMPKMEKTEARKPRPGTVFLPGAPEPASSRRIAN